MESLVHYQHTVLFDRKEFYRFKNGQPSNYQVNRNYIDNNVGKIWETVDNNRNVEKYSNNRNMCKPIAKSWDSVDNIVSEPKKFTTRRRYRGQKKLKKSN